MTDAYIIIRSEDRNKTLYPNPSSFSITDGITFFGESGIKYIQGESVQFFYNIPNINPRNNVILINTATMSYPVTVPQSFYDYNDLAIALAIQLNLLGLGAFTVTWNTTVYRFVITSPVPINILAYPPLVRDLGAVMGFAYDQALSTTITSQGADLTYTRNIYIVSNTINRNKKSNDQTSGQVNNILFTIPVYSNGIFERSNADVTKYDFLLNPVDIFYQPHNMKKICWNGDAIGDIMLEVYDDQDQLLYNPWGSQFSWSFRMSLITSK